MVSNTATSKVITDADVQAYTEIWFSEPPGIINLMVNVMLLELVLWVYHRRYRHSPEIYSGRRIDKPDVAGNVVLDGSDVNESLSAGLSATAQPNAVHISSFGAITIAIAHNLTSVANPADDRSSHLC